MLPTPPTSPYYVAKGTRESSSTSTESQGDDETDRSAQLKRIVACFHAKMNGALQELRDAVNPLLKHNPKATDDAQHEHQLHRKCLVEAKDDVATFTSYFSKIFSELDEERAARAQLETEHSAVVLELEKLRSYATAQRAVSSQAQLNADGTVPEVAQERESHIRPEAKSAQHQSHHDALANCEASLASARAEIASLRAQHARLADEHAESLRHSTQRIKEYQLQLDASEAATARLRTQNEEWSGRYRDLQALSTQELRKSQGKLTGAQDQAAELRRELEAARAYSADLDAGMREIQRNHDQTSADLKEERQERAELRRECEFLENEADELRRDLEDLHASNEDRLDEIYRLQQVCGDGRHFASRDRSFNHYPASGLTHRYDGSRYDYEGEY
jgi:chromosome segregation ATPase